MRTEEENKCCTKITSVHDIICDIPKQMRSPGCIGHAVMAIRARCDIRAEEQDYSTNSFRMAAYRQYILWWCDGVYMAFKRTLCTLHYLKYYYLCITNPKFATKMIFVTVLL